MNYQFKSAHFGECAACFEEYARGDIVLLTARGIIHLTCEDAK